MATTPQMAPPMSGLPTARVPERRAAYGWSHRRAAYGWSHPRMHTLAGEETAVDAKVSPSPEYGTGTKIIIKSRRFRISHLWNGYNTWTRSGRAAPASPRRTQGGWIESTPQSAPGRPGRGGRHLRRERARGSGRRGGKSRDDVMRSRSLARNPTGSQSRGHSQ